MKALEERARIAERSLAARDGRQSKVADEEKHGFQVDFVRRGLRPK
jgi:hypothetical protein